MRYPAIALAWAALVVVMMLMLYHTAIPDNVDLRGEAKYRAVKALGEGE